MMSVHPVFQFSIIIPVKRDDPFIERCVSSAMMSVPAGSEIIIVLDGWDTDRLDRFSRCGWVHVHGHPAAGPAVCRHFGALQAQHEWLCFLDSDVLVWPHTFSNAIGNLSESGDDGLIGSYDDRPEAGTVVSRFRNLLHHYHHQQNHGSAGVFWGAFGIVRRAAYFEAGGFDPGFRMASVEDIDLGYKLAELGYVIRIRQEVQVRHLKHWTLRGMIHTDIWLRARPWTLLMRKYRRWRHRPLNTSRREQLSALTAALTFIALAAVMISDWNWGYPLVFLSFFIALQWNFYRFALRHFHLLRLPQLLSLHHIYFCSATMGWLLAFVPFPGDPQQLDHA